MSTLKVTLEGKVNVQKENQTPEQLLELINDLGDSINTSWDALDKTDLIDDEDVIEKIDYIEINAEIKDSPIYTITVWLTEDIDADEQETIKCQLEFEVGYGLNEYIIEQFGDGLWQVLELRTRHRQGTGLDFT